MASRLIICQSRRLRQIIDLRDTDKSRYFAITEFNNCFIIRSPSLFFNEYPWKAKRSAIFTQERSQEGEKSICWSRGGLSANEKKEKSASNDNSHYYTLYSLSLLADNWLISVGCGRNALFPITISILVPCDGVFVVTFFETMYNKTIIRFGFSDILNNQGLGKCYQPRPSARLITLTSTLIIPDITKNLIQ